MRRTVVRAILSLFFFITLVLMFASIKTYAQGVKIEGKTIDYNLSYPGLLPDSPLYFVKSIRDTLLYFFTRDTIKKATLKLHHSDKKAYMAIELSKKGKWLLAVSTLRNGEKEFAQIPQLLKTAKSQGSAAEGNFILTLKLANKKHREVIETLLQEAPQGQTTTFNEALDINKTIESQLEKI